MRLVTFESGSESHAGIAIGESVVDATVAARAASIRVGRNPVGNRTILGWTRADQEHLGAVAAELAEGVTKKREGIYAAADVNLGPPIPDPDKIICLGLNYRTHAEEAGLELPKVPLLFAKFRNTLTGPTGPIMLPALSAQIDYEGELALVVGRRCKTVTVESALEFVAGYMVMNDVSARDIQMRTSQWLSGKTMDTFAPCGPALVVNEIRDPQDLRIATRVNGNTLQQSNTKDMIFSVAEIVAYVSQLMTLEPGDIISTGTPDGVGYKRNPPVFLRDGDMVEVEIERIGLLRNPVFGPRGAKSRSKERARKT